MRTRSPAHQETRQKILETARALVLKSGHESLSLREVARGAGFSPASLYEYFDSREAIVEALAKEAMASLRQSLERRVKASGASDHAALVALGMAYVGWAKSHREDFLLLFNRLPSTRHATTDRSAEGSPYRLVLDAVKRAHESGAVKAKGGESIESLAYGLWALAHGMAMLQLTHLASFRANFAAADRSALESLVDGWRS